MRQKWAGVRLGGFASRIPSPGFPQPVEVAVMRKEDRVARCGLEIRHIANFAAVYPTYVIVDWSMLCRFETIVAVSPSRIGPGDASKASVDLRSIFRLEDGCAERGDAELLQCRVVREIVDFAILHGTIECESDGFGERAAGTDEGLRDAAVAAPVPIWVCERRVSAYRTDL